MKVAVIGAGIAGVTAAYQLYNSGFEVTVYEKNEDPAFECSYANGGQVSVCNAEVWNTWSNVRKGIKWLTQPDAPLLIHPSLSYDKIAWLTGFLYHTLTNKYKINTTKTIEMGLASRDEYQSIIDETGIIFDRVQSGILHIYRTPQSLRKAKKSGDIFEANGVEWDYLTPQQIIDLEPTLCNAKDLVGGFYTESDWTGDAHKFCVELSKWLSERGVVFKYNTVTAHVKNIKGVPTVININNRSVSNRCSSHTFDIIVVSNGYAMKYLAADNGENLNLYPVKGYSITLNLDGENQRKAPTVSLLDDDAKIVTSRLGTNRLRIAGTAELVGPDDTVNQERIEPLKRWALANFPELEQDIEHQWACLRPMMSDMMPVVRQSKVKNIWYHGGHGHLGWTLSGYTSKKLVDDIKREMARS